MRFDRVIANPPFSLKNWGRDLPNTMVMGGYRYGVPPKDAGDLAFVQHMIASLNQEGVMGVVVPHGVLFRGGQEGEIRKGILEDDLVEAVIGLPSGLFYGTGIPCCTDDHQQDQEHADRKGKVLFINAELDYQEGKNQNILRDQDIEKIVECFDSYNDIKRFSRVVPIEEIRENDHNLNIRRYADTSPPPEPFDVRGILHGGVPIKETQERLHPRDP
jgi:type I restriction enzyme M protein